MMRVRINISHLCSMLLILESVPAIAQPPLDDSERPGISADLLREISEYQVELETVRLAATNMQTSEQGGHHSERPEPEVELIRSRNNQERAAGRLASGEHFVIQSWSQERKFWRPYYVNVPKLDDSRNAARQKYPVFLFLHGNGGNAKDAMRGFTRKHRQLLSRYVMVFPQGYQESWNIVSERSKADDRGFIEAIILKLSKFDNVNADNITIMGASNGAALVNQLAIECKLPNIRNYISGVSPLNVWQYDGEHFKAKGKGNNYSEATTPMTGKRFLNISGTDDQLVPYHGGPSQHIPAKDGKLAFVDAEESTFLWARQMGFDGEQLEKPTRVDGNLEMFSYLNGDVVHCKVINEGHGATHVISERVLLEFLEGADPAQRNE